MNPVRSLILAAAGNDTIRRVVATAPVTRDVVARFVGGRTVQDAVRVSAELAAAGLRVTLDHLGEQVIDRAQATATVRAYEELLDRLQAGGLAKAAEVSLKLSAVGQGIDEQLAVQNAALICEAAERAGTTVTVDAEDHTTTDSTLRVLTELRGRWPWVGAVLQAYLRRTEADCAALAVAGCRVRLCKGAYAEPESVAFDNRAEVDRSYVRCANLLLCGAGYPMFATHDPRLIDIVQARATATGRHPDRYEFQMLYGVRPDAQLRLSDAGHIVRVYVPYGTEWYGYLMRRLAERPANAAFFLRALLSRA